MADAFLFQLDPIVSVEDTQYLHIGSDTEDNKIEFRDFKAAVATDPGNLNSDSIPFSSSGSSITDKHNADVGAIYQNLNSKYGDNIPMTEGGQTIKQVHDADIASLQDSIDDLPAKVNSSTIENLQFNTLDLNNPALVAAFGDSWYDNSGMYSSAVTEAGDNDVRLCSFIVLKNDTRRIIWVKLYNLSEDTAPYKLDYAIARLVFPDPANDPTTGLNFIFHTITNSDYLYFANEVKPDGNPKTITEKIGELGPGDVDSNQVNMVAPHDGKTLTEYAAEVDGRVGYPFIYSNTFNYLDGYTTIALVPRLSPLSSKRYTIQAKIPNTGTPPDPTNATHNLDKWKIIGSYPVYQSSSGIPFGDEFIEAPDGVGSEDFLFDFTASGSFAPFVDHVLMTRMYNNGQVDKVELDFELYYQTKGAVPVRTDRRQIIINPVKTSLNGAALAGAVIMPGILDIHSPGVGFHNTANTDYLMHSIIFNSAGMYWKFRINNHRDTEMNYEFNITLYGINFIGLL